MEKEYSLEELKDITRQLLKTDLTIPDNLLSLLGMSKEIYKHDAELSRKIAQKVRSLAMKQCVVDIRHYDIYNSALLLLAQLHLDFDAYMLYIEKNRDPEEQYYLPRRKQLRWLVAKMQRLLDDEIDILSISMPPGTGKTLHLDGGR